MGCSIAVGEILCCLAIHLCCRFARPYLPEFFLPHGQVGVGISGSLEAAVYAVHHSLCLLGSDDSLALLNIDIKMHLMNVIVHPCLTVFLKIS